MSLLYHGRAGPKHVIGTIGRLGIGHRSFNVEMSGEAVLQALVPDPVLFQTRPINDLLVKQVLVLVYGLSLGKHESTVRQVHPLVPDVHAIVRQAISLAKARWNKRR